MVNNLNIEKIGNLMILLSQRVPNLYLTKMLKLIYIIDEVAISESGSPVTWLDYKVWEKGPVATDIYYDLLNNNELFSRFITPVNSTSSLGIGKKICAEADFDDSEFSDYEIDLIERIVEECRFKGSDELIHILHGQDTLWLKAVKENKLAEQFAFEKTSNISIDLTQRIKDNPSKMGIYNSVKQMLEL
jgi:uncharacterized phage-associated protein